MFIELQRIASLKLSRRMIRITALLIVFLFIFFMVSVSGMLIGLTPPGQKGKVAPSGKTPIASKIRAKDNTDKINSDRVREMARHSWMGYKKYAWGNDELKPVSKTGRNWTDASYLFTPIDSLDTLFIMGLKTEYKEAKELVIEKLDIDQPDSKEHNHFELVIRVLGGLLSAYDLDPDPRYLKKAIKVADRLMVAFETSNLPPQDILMITGKGNSDRACLASVGTLQLEFQYMSDLTGNPKYQKKALAIYDVLEKMNENFIPGLYFGDIIVSDPPHFRSATGSYGIGGAMDSFYEYLLKMFISTKEEKYGLMYDRSRDAIIKHLLKTYNTSVILPNRVGSYHTNTFEHLACFAGGMLSLGSKVRNGDKQAAKHFEIGQAITETCQKSYDESSNGLGGESFSVREDGSTSIVDQEIKLRPEVIESVFYHYRFTKDQKYRDFGARMITNLDKHSKTDAGYSALSYNSKIDSMESFFMAETLKYLYLLFSDDSIIPLNEYVFNTEAHPFSIRGFGRRKDPSKWIPL